MELILRKITKDDLSMIMKWRMLPEVTEYMYTNPKITLEGQIQWYKNVSEGLKCKYWIIQCEKKPIGLISINDIDKENKKCVWAYYIADTTFRGRGIARLLECNIYDYVFRVLELNKICCEVFKFNEKVISIHEKFGAEVEGILKEHIIKENVKYDVVIMGLLKSKWDVIREQYNYDEIIIE